MSSGSPAETGSRERIRQDYSRSGAGYDEVRLGTARGLYLTRYDAELFRRIVPALPEGASVLEVGAGTGRFTLEMLERGCRLTATDVNETMLESLRSKLESRGYGDRCDVRQEDVFRLSFPDDSFDLVFCLHVVPRFLNFADQRAALLELGRVVRPGGALLVNFRNARSPYRFVYRGPAAEPDAVRDALRERGLRVEQVRVKHVLNGRLLDRTPRVLWPFFRSVDRLLEPVLSDLGWDVFVLARKQPT